MRSILPSHDYKTISCQQNSASFGNRPKITQLISNDQPDGNQCITMQLILSNFAMKIIDIETMEKIFGDLWSNSCATESVGDGINVSQCYLIIS